MKQIFLQFYATLSNHEKKTFWLGSVTFTIGFISLIDTLRPPSWWGWQEAKGELVGVQSIEAGQYNGGNTVYIVQYFSADGQNRTGTFYVSPVILAAMKTIRVYYQKNDPSVFYVYNPTRFVIGFTLTLFGVGVLISFYLYYKDRRKGINYD